MKESIHKYFKVGIVSFMAYPSTLRGTDENVLPCLQKTVYDDYFDAIETTWIKDDARRAAAAALFAASHITVCYGAQPRLLTTGLNACDVEEAGRAAAQATLMEAIDEAEQLGAGGIAFLAGKWAPETQTLAYAQLLKTTEALCDYAAGKGMMVELEVFDYDIAKKSLIGPAPYAAQFAGDVRKKHSNFGLLVDLSHIPMTHESSEFVMRTLRPYITHFHIGNTVCVNATAEGYGDEHQRFGFPEGANDVPQVLDFLRVLKTEGFFSQERPYVLSFEVKPWKSEDPDAVVAGAKRTLNRAWALLED